MKMIKIQKNVMLGDAIEKTILEIKGNLTY